MLMVEINPGSLLNINHNQSIDQSINQSGLQFSTSSGMSPFIVNNDTIPLVYNLDI